MRRLLVLVGALSLLAACSQAASTEASRPASEQTALATNTTTVHRALTVGGRNRTYLAVGPDQRKPGLPLLIVLHGRGINAQEESVRTGFLPYAEQGLADLVYPAGISESWNAGHGCCGVAGREGVPDVPFIGALVTDAAHYFEADSRRIYLVGYSNGARLAFSTVCAHPGVFAAMATYGGVPLAECPDTTPISAMITAGTADPVVKAAHSSPSASAAIESTVTQWRTRNGCTTSATQHIGPLALTTWRGCKGGTVVAAGLYNGLTHYWPVATHTGAPFTTVVGADAAAATIMWNFLSPKHL
ncbi:MAG TPA: PHB depolymerase family esterase [Amycolatopsis sp.]|nr:PHB depolymerase family esterase [Amycolatopsis sp.]